MNRGDAKIIKLEILIDNTPITESYADEIELTINKQGDVHCIKKTLSNGDIVWNSEYGMYEVYLSQNDTFTLCDGNNPSQIRILKNNLVVSSGLVKFELGDANSKEELPNAE